jgi:hypothetical protein
VRRGRGGDVRGGESDALGGQRNGPCHQLTRFPQRDVYRPVLATEFGELTGAVQRVDDPHPLSTQPAGVGALLIRCLFGEHCIVGPLGGERLHQEMVRSLVSGGFAFARLRIRELDAYAEQ